MNLQKLLADAQVIPEHPTKYVNTFIIPVDAEKGHGYTIMQYNVRTRTIWLEQEIFDYLHMDNKRNCEAIRQDIETLFLGTTVDKIYPISFEKHMAKVIEREITLDEIIKKYNHETT